MFKISKIYVLANTETLRANYNNNAKMLSCENLYANLKAILKIFPQNFPATYYYNIIIVVFNCVFTIRPHW